MANAAPVRVNHIAKALSLWRTDQNGLSPVRYDGIEPDREGAFAGRTSRGGAAGSGEGLRRSLFLLLALDQCLAIITSEGVILLDAMDNDWEAGHVIGDGLNALASIRRKSAMVSCCTDTATIMAGRTI